MFSAEQIVTKLREIEASLANGKSVSLACRDAGIKEVRKWLEKDLSPEVIAALRVDEG